MSREIEKPARLALLLSKAHAEILKRDNPNMELVRKIEQEVYSCELTGQQRVEAIRRADIN